MRFNKYLTEKKATKNQIKTDEVVDNICSIIEPNCKEIINIYKKSNGMLFRGITGTGGFKIDKPDSYFIEKTGHKTVRPPRNTQKEIHRYLNELFKDKFGWKVRDGIFVTSSEIFAAHYGYVFAVFPQGKFKYVWSPKYRDLYTKVPDIPVGYGIKSNEWLKTNKKKFVNIVNKYKDNNIEDAIKKGNEISIKCNKYYLIRFDIINDVAKKLDIR